MKAKYLPIEAIAQDGRLYFHMHRVGVRCIDHSGGVRHASAELEWVDGIPYIDHFPAIVLVSSLVFETHLGVVIYHPSPEEWRWKVQMALDEPVALKAAFDAAPRQAMFSVLEAV